MNNRQKIFSTLVISAAISACGGGGGGGTPTPPAQIINEANLVEVSQLSYSSGLLLTAFEVLATMPGAESLAGMPGFDIQTIIKHQTTEAFRAAYKPAAVVGVVLPPQTSSCSVSGTVTLTAEDADNNGDLSVGDKGIFVYQNCVTVTAGGSYSRNGKVTTTFTKLIGEIDPLNAYESGLNILFENLALGIVGTTGIMNGNLSSDTVNNPSDISTNTITTPSLNIAIGAATLVYTNYQTDSAFNNLTTAYSNSVQGSFAASGLGSFNLSTPTPFQGVGNANPSAGVLKIDAADSTAFVTAIDVLNARLDLDKSNDASIDYNQIVPWSALSFI